MEDGYMTDWASIKSKADAIRKQYIDDKPPVNVFDIAGREGVDIIYFVPDDNTDEISGLLDINKRTVYLNASDSASRQNFTLAHELAHYFLEHRPDEYGVYLRNSLYQEQKPEKEQTADVFAAELLMPRSFIRKIQNDYSLTDDDALALARLFGVPKAVMQYRLKGLRNEQA
jgi:Zn-dependent peptidase ImmA (M78 family)